MRHAALTLAGLFTLLACSEAAAQGYMRGASRPRKAADEEADEAPRRKSKKAADEEAGEEEAPKKKRKPGDGKALVEEYLRERLSVSQKNWHDQKAFGSKTSQRWEQFFAELYEDRKRFETSIARHRLNLMETMASVGDGYRAQALKDFEQMQGTMLKSFASSQQQRMNEFFGRLMEDLKVYAADQERRRAELLTVSMEAWQEQKAAMAEPPGKRR